MNFTFIFELITYRENYLGHSLSAPVGRWQKGKDLSWYAKSGSSSQQLDANQQLQEEKRRLKEQDEDLINQAIGIKVQKRKFVENQIDDTELKQILAKGNIERESVDIERVKGIGSAPVKVHDHIERFSSVSKEIIKLKKQMEPTASSSSSLLSSSTSSNPNIIQLKRKPDDNIESKSYISHENSGSKHRSGDSRSDGEDIHSSREHSHTRSHSHKNKKEKKEKKEHKHKKDHKKERKEKHNSE